MSCDATLTPCAVAPNRTTHCRVLGPRLQALPDGAYTTKCYVSALPFFKRVPIFFDLRCVLHPARSSSGCKHVSNPGSTLKKLKPILFMIGYCRFTCTCAVATGTATVMAHARARANAHAMTGLSHPSACTAKTTPSVDTGKIGCVVIYTYIHMCNRLGTSRVYM